MAGDPSHLEGILDRLRVVPEGDAEIADARIELEELAASVDARLTWEEDEVDTLGGLMFLLAGHIVPPGESARSPYRAEKRVTNKLADRTSSQPDKHFDVLVVGAGPAGAGQRMNWST